MAHMLQHRGVLIILERGGRCSWVRDYHPTLLKVTDSSLPIVQQEVFGPALTPAELVQAHLNVTSGRWRPSRHAKTSPSS